MKTFIKSLLLCFLTFSFAGMVSAQTAVYPTVAELRSGILRIGKAIETDFNSLKGKKQEGSVLSGSFLGTVHLLTGDEAIAINASDNTSDRYRVTLLRAKDKEEMDPAYRRWLALTNIALTDYYSSAETELPSGNISKVYFSPANKPISVTVTMDMDYMRREWQISMEISATGYKDVSTMAYAKKNGLNMKNYYSPAIDKILALRKSGVSFLEELEAVPRIIADAEAADKAKAGNAAATAPVAAPTELCGLFPAMIKDSETQFKNARGRFINEVNDIKSFEATYKLDGQPFAYIKEMKNGTNYLFAFLEVYNSKAEAETGLLEFAKRNTCTNGIMISKRNTRTGEHYLEYTQREGNGFYVANAVTQIVEADGKFYISLEIYQKDDTFFQPVTVPQSKSEFSAAVLDLLAKAKSDPNWMKQGKKIIRPETTKWTTIFETELKFPNAECFLSKGLVTYPQFVASFSAGKNADKATLDILFKECLEQMNLTFGNTGYYFANMYYDTKKDDVAYFPFAQLGFGRTQEVLRLHKDEALNTVNIIIR